MENIDNFKARTDLEISFVCVRGKIVEAKISSLSVADKAEWCNLSFALMQKV